MKPISERQIDDLVDEHIKRAEKLACQQLDGAQHQDVYFNYNAATHVKHKGTNVLDPWLREDMQGVPWAWEAHKDPEMGVDPFDYYGKHKMARFVEEILMKRG